MSTMKESNTCPDGYRALSTCELRDLLQNDDKMDQILRLNEKFQELQVDRETLQTTNRSLAEDSLARRPRLCNGKLQLAEKYRELSNLATACWEKRSQLEAHGEKHSLQTAQNLLQEEVARAEEHSEELLEKFMEGNVSLDEFLDSFQSSRKTYHVRRAQAEKMQDAARAKRPPSKAKKTAMTTTAEESKEVKKDSEQPQEPQRPNGFVAQGPLRVFQVRYGLTPAILLPHYPVSPPASAPSHQSSTPPPESQLGHQTHILGTGNPLPGHGHQPVGLRVIGQLPGGWPAHGRPVRVQQLYRPNPQQPEPPYR
ncbi:vacuolar protein sorting-associated protein 37D [Anarrhichthys ocellatus]|uniref:vacuolar protein sorting-associated protein 37D n=1 Tax=Anarrhichthys ocellatus TaxID=433405 RepID=UPI0012ED2D71|nr:vacuolar protein sorting-associated protein 37D-like [Anarrhichthys ocellatus]